MNTTIRHISHLLRDCDVLAVPGLGVFRRRYISARFEDSVLLPPSEEIVFMTQENADDDFLAMSIARCLACEKSVARERIAEDVAEIRNRLEAGQKVQLGEAGALVPVSSLGGIAFEESVSGRRLNTLSWLKPVEAMSVEEIASEPEADAEVESRRNIFMQSLQRTASSAAAIALLALIAFVASQLPGKSTPEPQMASFGFERTERPLAVEPVEQPSDKALVLILNTPADGMSIVDPAEKKAVAAVRTNPEDSYFLIVASLSSADEARKFISSYPESLDLGILEADGRCRVYASSGSSFASVKSQADSKGLFDRFPNAWICRK